MKTEQARKLERDAIVDWLRRCAKESERVSPFHEDTIRPETLLQSADAIERGAHLEGQA